MAWPWKVAQDHQEKVVQAENHFDLSELDQVWCLLWLGEGGWEIPVQLQKKYQLWNVKTFSINLLRWGKEKATNSEWVSSSASTPPLATRSVPTRVLGIWPGTQGRQTWSSPPSEWMFIRLNPPIPPINLVGQQTPPIQGPGPGRERHNALCERNVYQFWTNYLEAGRVVACRWSTINFQDLLLKSSQIIVSHLLYLGNIPEIKKNKTIFFTASLIQSLS